MTARRIPGPPAYIKAQDAVLTLVRAERLLPGARVPSERALANSLGLSRMTVRQGMENLVRAGILARDSTSGTRVADTRNTRALAGRRIAKMSQIVPKNTARGSVRVLAFIHDLCDQALADDLHIALGSDVIRVRRLRTADALPFCIETSVLPAALAPGLSAQHLSKDRAIDEILTDHYAIPVTDRSSEIGASPIGAEDAKLLGMTAGTNVLVYRTLVRNPDGVPVSRTISLNHPDRVVFSTGPTPLTP